MTKQYIAQLKKQNSNIWEDVDSFDFISEARNFIENTLADNLEFQSGRIFDHMAKEIFSECTLKKLIADCKWEIVQCEISIEERQNRMKDIENEIMPYNDNELGLLGYELASLYEHKSVYENKLKRLTKNS